MFRTLTRKPSSSRSSRRHGRLAKDGLRVVKRGTTPGKVFPVLASVLAFACAPAGAALALPADSGETLIAAGDIAQCDLSGYVGTGAEATARLIDRIPGTVLALGDLAYPNGTEREFRQC